MVARLSFTKQHCKLFQECEPFSFVELFAGQAEATHSFRSSDYRSARLDIIYMGPQEGRQNPMDLNSDPGFLSLGWDLVGGQDVKLDCGSDNPMSVL